MWATSSGPNLSVVSVVFSLRLEMVGEQGTLAGPVIWGAGEHMFLVWGENGRRRDTRSVGCPHAGIWNVLFNLSILNVVALT